MDVTGLCTISRDCLAAILALVSSKDLLNLLECGTPTLTRRIPPLIEEFELVCSRKGWPNPSWLEALFPALRSLDLHLRERLPPNVAIVNDLPTGLISLEVHKVSSLLVLSPASSDGTSTAPLPAPLVHRLPNLTHLAISTSTFITKDCTAELKSLIRKLPLQSLDIASLSFYQDIADELPPTLTFLRTYILENAAVAQNAPFILPPQLTSLTLNTNLSMETLDAAIPSTVIHLDITRGMKLQTYDWNAFPRSLVSLQLKFCGSLTIAMAKLLPNSLRTLRIRDSHPIHEDAAIGFLPRQLETLCLLQYRPPSDVEIAWPPSLAELKLHSTPPEIWQSLPRTLTSDFLVSASDLLFIHHLPPLTLKITVSDSSTELLQSLPPHINSLQLLGKRSFGNHCSASPPSKISSFLTWSLELTR